LTIYKISDRHRCVVLIHGLGATEKGWLEPLEERILLVSFKTLLKEESEVTPFIERLKGQYNIATWTQSPYCLIDDAARELKAIAESIKSKRMIFIAHSRGGLIARCAMQKYGIRPQALICLSTPHHGSMLADFTMKYFFLLQWILPSLKGYKASIMELCTDSTFIKELNSPRAIEQEKDIPRYDICGNSTSFFHLICIRSLKLLNIAGVCEKIFGNRSIPELKHGYGDGMTSTQSCKSPLTVEENHIVFPVNHANILIDTRVWNSVKTILQKYGDNQD